MIKCKFVFSLNVMHDFFVKNEVKLRKNLYQMGLLFLFLLFLLTQVNNKLEKEKNYKNITTDKLNK